MLEFVCILESESGVGGSGSRVRSAAVRDCGLRWVFCGGGGVAAVERGLRRCVFGDGGFGEGVVGDGDDGDCPSRSC